MSQEYQIAILPEAESQLRQITDQRVARQIANRIRGLRESPEQQGRALWGELSGHRRVRAASGRYRVVYRVSRDRLEVTVVAVEIRREGSKRDVYRLAYRMAKRGFV